MVSVAAVSFVETVYIASAESVVLRTVSICNKYFTWVKFATLNSLKAVLNVEPRKLKIINLESCYSPVMKNNFIYTSTWEEFTQQIGRTNTDV